MKIAYKIISISLFIMSIGLVGVQTNALSGSDFNPARIIDDGIFFNKNTMNTGDIQNFLNAKVPVCRSGYVCLKSYSQSFSSVAADSFCGSITGGNKSAANIIFDVSQACGINPQVILVLLQKEQSLVTDDWPIDIQYRSATGFGCPDTAACDSQYYGFFNQVYRAARQFKRYVAQPQNYNYAVGRNSFVAYQANNPGCGGTNITIQTSATAALYNYTPYQPNAAALNNLYGSGDGCSAYGNRNFWRMFTEWFGPTTGTGYILARNQDDNSQWVIYNNIKQYIPSGDIIEAFGLGSNPVTMSGSYLSTFPSGPHLGRLIHAQGSPALYFVDGGKKYYVPSSKMKDTFGFNGQAESYVSNDLFDLPTDSGWLSYAVKKATDPSLYMVDGLNGSNQIVLRQYSSPDVFHAWEGDNAYYTTLSNAYFDGIDNAIGTTLTGYTVKGSNDPTQYHVIAGQKLYLSGAMAAAYNQSYQTVSPSTISRLVSSSPVTNFIRLPGEGVTIYMADNQKKRPISSPNVLRSWSPNNNVSVNILNQGFLNLLTTDSTINSYQADVDGQLYTLDGKKYTVPEALDSAYRLENPAIVSQATINLFSNDTVTGFIKGSGPAIYLLDNGVKRHIPSLEVWQLWNGSRNEAVTQLSDSVINQFTNGGEIGYYFTSEGTNYVIENGQYRTASTQVANDWGLTNPTTIQPSTRNRFTSGSPLDSKVVVDGATYYRIKQGKSHKTNNSSIAAIWGVNNSPAVASAHLVNRLQVGPSLNIYARSTNSADNRIFLVDNSGSTFYHIGSVEQKQNFGANDNVVPVSPSELGTPAAAQNIIGTASSDTYRIMDNSKKRNFSNSTVRDRWSNGSNHMIVSQALWEYFTDGETIGGNIKGSAPNIYTVESGQKKWIQSQSSYQSHVGSYGPYSQVSDYLISVTPTGANIP